MDKNVSQKAAKWWADQLRGTAKLDDGDNTLEGKMRAENAAMLQETEKQKQSPELINKFELELANIILVDNFDFELTNTIMMGQERIWKIGVDYHPDGLLQEAANRAGLPLEMTTLPWKTTMWIEDEKITVHCGYSAKLVTL